MFSVKKTLLLLFFLACTQAGVMGVDPFNYSNGYQIAYIGNNIREESMGGYMTIYGCNTYYIWAHWRDDIQGSARGVYNFQAFDDKLAWGEENEFHALVFAPMWYPPTWFYEIYPDAYMRTWNGTAGTYLEGALRPTYNHPGYVNETYWYLQTLINYTMDNNYSDVVANWVYENEPVYSFPTFSWWDGRWWDYSDTAKARFKNWTKEEYNNNINALNTMWGTSYTSWDQIAAPKLEIANPELPTIADFDLRNATPQIVDWIMFRQHELAEFQEYMCNVSREFDPETATSIKTILSPLFGWAAGFMGVDGEAIGLANDIFQPDIYGEAPLQAFGVELSRSITDNKRIWIGEGNHFGGSAQQLAVIPWAATGHGATGYTFYSWEPWAGEWHPDLAFTDMGEPLPKADEVAKFAHHMHRLGPLIASSTFESADIAIYHPKNSFYTQEIPSLNDHWALHDPLTEIYEELILEGYRVDFITDRQIARGDLANYKVLILQVGQDIDPDIADNITSFVNGGGYLLADVRAGYFDHKHRHQDVLSSVLGVTESSFLSETSDYINFGSNTLAPSLAGTNARFVVAEKLNKISGDIIGTWSSDGSAAIVYNNYGSGKSLMIGTYMSGIFRGGGVDPSLRSLIMGFLAASGAQRAAYCDATSIDIGVLNTYDSNKLLIVTNFEPSTYYSDVAITVPFSGAERVLYLQHDTMEIQNLSFIEDGSGNLTFTLPELLYAGAVLITRGSDPLVGSELAVLPEKGETVNFTVEFWNLNSSALSNVKFYVTFPSGWNATNLTPETISSVPGWGVASVTYSVTVPDRVSHLQNVIKCVAEYQIGADVRNTTPCTNFFKLKVPATLRFELIQFGGTCEVDENYPLSFVIYNDGTETAGQIQVSISTGIGMQISGSSSKGLGDLPGGSYTDKFFTILATQGGQHTVYITVSFYNGTGQETFVEEITIWAIGGLAEESAPGTGLWDFISTWGPLIGMGALSVGSVRMLRRKQGVSEGQEEEGELPSEIAEGEEQ